jgi:hypothetical protein
VAGRLQFRSPGNAAAIELTDPDGEVMRASEVRRKA